MDISLLHALEAAGIRLHAEGDQVRAEIPAVADLAPFREQIATHKPALLRALVQRETIVELTDQVARGWDWLSNNPAHPEHEAFLDRWIARLREYEQTYAAHHEQGEASCRAS